jgi:phenylpyruvate tautomerase PptA (4-oxalocrotonate tautomerase family)
MVSIKEFPDDNIAVGDKTITEIKKEKELKK